MSRTTREIIDSVIEEIEFTKPVELADVLEVKKRIDHELARFSGPALPRVEVYHRIRDVVITARETFNGREQVTYNRILEAK